ncbi:DUF6941 family protein [Paraburkholderia phosphatilytica]|uniref:DUF6941 family protein n=1 Tax=Paraburkholderia phosphatilytica TaxID=2282883 RepID=UPI000E5018BC|nr:hypothetical protein [Paraburkholderia phosphatilytica]
MTRYAHTLFCDDIRMEVGGKSSLMGLYHGELLVPQNPTVLPKLCVVVTVVTGSDNPFKTLSMTIASKDRLFAEQIMPADAVEQIQNHLRSSSDPEDPITRMAIILQMAISPFVVDEAFTLKVFVTADGEKLPAGRLRVNFAASAQQEGSR